MMSKVSIANDALKVIKRVHDITGGVPQVVLLTGWQFEGHDSKYPSWTCVNKHLKREQDETALDSLRWLIREARQYNCLGNRSRGIQADSVTF